MKLTKKKLMNEWKNGTKENMWKKCLIFKKSGRIIMRKKSKKRIKEWKKKWENERDKENMNEWMR